MICLVIVLFLFKTRVFDTFYLHAKSFLVPNPLHAIRKFGYPVLFIKLVHDPIFSRVWRIVDENCNTLDGILQCEKAPSLPALPVYRKRVPNHCLLAVPVNHGSKNLVKVEPGHLRFILHFPNPRPIDNALHDISRGKVPQLASKHDVIAIMHLAPVVPASSHSGVWDYRLFSPEFYFHKPFSDIDVIPVAVFSHGAKLYQMGSWDVIFL